MGIDLKFLVTEKSSVLSAGAFLTKVASVEEISWILLWAMPSCPPCARCHVQARWNFSCKPGEFKPELVTPKKNISMKVPIRNTFLPCGDICRCVFRQKNFEKSFGTARLEGPITLHFFLFHLRQKSPGPKQVPSTCVVPPTT